MSLTGRYYLIAAIVNQLRYPNAHTLWFSSFLLATFADTEDDIVKEQIIRVLLERVLCQRPHCFGCKFPCPLAHRVRAITD